MSKKKKLGIIDWEKKGNVVRFYIGNASAYYGGDDWDDCPYEHNAGRVYDEYIDHHIDIAFPFDCTVLEPQDDWRYRGNSCWCKDDFKKRKCPCIIVVPYVENTWVDDCFSDYMASEEVIQFYFGDELILDDVLDHMMIIHKVRVSYELGKEYDICEN